MKDKKATQIVSFWEILKELIERENIYAGEEIENIDCFIYNQVINELKEYE